MNIENLKTKAEADISEYITKKIIELKKKTGKEVTSIQFTAREKMTGLESYDVKINLMYSIIKFIHKPRFYGVLLYLNGSEYLNHNC